MGSKGSATASTSSSPNPTAMAAYNDILSRAQGVAGTPYTAYTGELVAPVNAQQSTGIANINSNWNYAQPYLQTAAGYAQDAATPLTTAQIQQYMSPFTQGVVNATQAQFDNQNEQQRQRSVGNAISQGALGGNRQGIAEAELAGQQHLAQAPVIAGLYNQAYTSGLNTALTEQQARAQGAYSLGNLGVSGQNAALTGANAQVGAGTLEQQIKQAQDAASYQQFVNQQAYPFQTTQWLAGIGTGVGSQMGGTGTSTAPPPNSTAQWLGLGTAGVGAVGQAGGWAALAGMMADGGAVNGRASGGVANRHATMPETPATLKLQQRQLMAGHRRVQMFPRGTPELPLPRGMSRLETDSGSFHYDPRRIDAGEIHRHSDSGRENEMLDLGPFSKDDILKRMHGGEIPVAVVERHPDGTEARAAIGTHVTADRQMAAMNRAKSPGHSVRIEDPRETIGHRARAFGGRVENYADGGGSFGGAKGWIPEIGITAGRGAPDAPRPAGPAPNNGKATTDAMLGLGKAFQGVFDRQGTNGLATDKPDNESEIYTGDASRPGFPGRGLGQADGGGVWGYADGGAPEEGLPPTNGVGAMIAGSPHGTGRGWIPKMEIARRQSAGVAPPPTPEAPSLAQQAKEIGSLAKMIQNPSSAAETTGADAHHSQQTWPGAEDAIGYAAGGSPSDGVANLPYHLMVPHLAEGGSPYDTNYFDQTFATPIRHTQEAYEIVTNPERLTAWRDRALMADNPGYKPQPRPKSEGLAPSYDLPPEIMTGRSRGAPAEQRALGFADEGRGARPAQRPVQVVEGDRPSRMDNAAWPQGPAGAPGGEGYDAMAREPAAPRRPQGPSGAGAEPPPQGVAPAKSKIDLSSNSKLWPSMMAAGFGMMASKSPFLGSAVGEGGMAGMQTYASERTREDHINSEAKKLAQQASQAQQRLDLATRQHTEQSADQKAKSDEAKRYHDILGTRMQLKPTGTMVETPSGPHPVFLDGRSGMSFDGITGEPVAPDAKIIAAPGKAGAIQTLARELMRDREDQRRGNPALPSLTLDEAVGLAHRSPDADRGTARKLSLAQGAWKAWNADIANMSKKNAPEKELSFWEKRYGVDGVAGGAPAAGAAPPPAAGTPAAAAKTMQPIDRQALDWANANPTDPRAAAIKKRLGVP